MRAEHEITSRIDRQELLGLLDSTRLGEQRVTAEIAVPALDQLLESEAPSMRTPPPGETQLSGAVADEPDSETAFVIGSKPTEELVGSDFVINFRTAIAKPGISTLHVVVASFAATLAIGFAFVLSL